MNANRLLEILDRVAADYPQAGARVLERDKDMPIDSDDAFRSHQVVGIDIDHEEPAVDLETDPDGKLPGLSVEELACQLRSVVGECGDYQVFGRLEQVFEDGTGLLLDSPIVATNNSDEEFWAVMWFENYYEELTTLG